MQWRIVVKDGRIVEVMEVVGVEGSRVLFERYLPLHDAVLKRQVDLMTRRTVQVVDLLANLRKRNKLETALLLPLAMPVVPIAIRTRTAGMKLPSPLTIAKTCPITCVAHIMFDSTDK